MPHSSESDIARLIMRAFSFIGHSEDMVFVGIYSTDGSEPLAVADREQVRVNPVQNSETWTKPMPVNVHPSQVQAIIRHIRTPDNVLCLINIADLHFVCLRNGTGSMTGMSNFNMDIKRDSVRSVNNTIYSIAKERYSSQDLLGGVHALQISAILREEFIIIGLSRASEESSLKILKDILNTSIQLKKDKSNVFEPTKMEQRMAGPEFSNGALNTPRCPQSAGDVESLNRDSEVFVFPNRNEQVNEENVQFRASTKADKIRRRDQMKRETSYSEDWRTATIRSIEALRMIGPFTDDDISDRDDRPLMSNIASIDSSGRTEPKSTASSASSSNRDSGSKEIGGARKLSRATMV